MDSEFEYLPRNLVLQQHQVVAQEYGMLRDGSCPGTTALLDEQGAVAPCLTPVAELKPVTLRELRAHVGHFVPGRVLHLTTLHEPAQFPAIQFPSVDDEGTAIQVSVHNQTGGKILTKAQLQRLYPPGSRVLVKNPYIKREMRKPMVRVDHPVNLEVELSEGGARQGPAVQTGEGGGQSALEVAETFKKRGNDEFQKGDYCGAIKQYDKVLLGSGDLPAALAATIHNNRAACFLKLGKNVEARAAARKVLASDPCNKKAIFRLSSAQTALGKHQEAVAAFARLT